MFGSAFRRRACFRRAAIRGSAVGALALASALASCADTLQCDAAGAGRTDTATSVDEEARVDVDVLATSSTVHPLAALSPYPPVRIFRPNPSLEIAFDVRTRNPLYVLERLECGSGDGDDDGSRSKRKRPNFFEDKSLPEEYRSRLHHYKHSGFDRGHLAAAADFDDDKRYRDTFTLCNVSPQDHAMNVSIWSKLENWCRSVARREKDADVYVVTGPLWLPMQKVDENKYRYGHLAIGSHPPSLVQVPTHFFKIVAVVRSSRLHKYACFVVPNAQPWSSELEDYIVHWHDLEAVSGLQFFPVLSSGTSWKDRLAVITDAARPKQRRMPMLTDGRQEQSSSKRLWQRRMTRSIVHLCANGSCRSKK